MITVCFKNKFHEFKNKYEGSWARIIPSEKLEQEGGLLAGAPVRWTGRLLVPDYYKFDVDTKWEDISEILFEQKFLVV